MKDYLPFALPDIGEEEIAEVVETLKSGWITTGPKVAQFEEDFKNYIGCDYAISVNSATAGLHLALESIGLTRGDKVLTTPYTFTATSEVIRYFDADPVYCDIDPLTFNIDPVEVEKKLKADPKGYKAILPVHMAGQAADMKALKKLAEQYQLKIIEDAAHALPTTCEGELVGTLSDITVFSFYATKTLACGEGGMVTTNDETLAKRMKVMRLHGLDRDAWKRYQSQDGSWFYEVVAPGYKYNLNDMAAGLGLAQLRKLDRFYERRCEIARMYDEAFGDDARIEIPGKKVESDQHAYHLYIIRVDSTLRNMFIDKMKEKGIGCSVHFIPLHLQPYWRDRYQLRPEDFPRALKAYEGAVSLPIYTKMSDGDATRVIQAVHDCLDELS